MLIGALFLLARCQPAKVPQAHTAVVNQEFELALNQSVALLENERPGKDTRLGKIKLVQLDDSRCPAHATCIRQGAVITSLEIEEPHSETQTVRLFIGDMMTNDSRNKRNITADTLLVKWQDTKPFQVILKAVRPYPGTSAEAPHAVLRVKRP